MVVSETVTRRITALAALAFAFFAVAATPAHAQRVQGSGSTFAYPVISAWSKSFLEFRAGGNDFVSDELGVDYEPIGSMGGIMRLSQPDVDLAASDAPLPPEELAKRDLAQFPIVVGGLAAVVNLKGLAADTLRLDGDALARIFLGEITRWDDAAIVALNPGVALPDLGITVIHSIDGSGSTLTWTRYLSASNAQWRAGPGSDTFVAWPVGTGAEGSSGMLQAVGATEGSIGYAEFGQVERAGLGFAQISNRAGTFVAPSPAAFAATAAMAGWDPANDFYVQLADVEAAEAYPLTAATFVLMHKQQRSVARTRRRAP